jgi:hypothetical protein
MPNPTPPLRRATAALAIAVPATLLAVLGLAACGDAPGTPAPARAPEASAEEPAGGAALARLNAYVGVHNVVVNGGGAEGVREAYERATLDTKRKTGPGFAVTWVPQALDELRQAGALPSGGDAELESAAEALRTALEPLHRAVSPLPAYFGSRAWTDDDGAALKAGRPAVLAALDGAAPAIDRFDAALERATAAESAKRLASLKESGDALVYGSALAMSQGKALIESTQAAVSAVPSSGGKRGAAPDWSAPNATLASLDATLAGMRTEIERRRQADRSGLQNLPYREFESVASSLTDLTGAYRDFRTHGDRRSAETMVRVYNNAVGYQGRTPSTTYRRE